MVFVLIVLCASVELLLLVCGFSWLAIGVVLVLCFFCSLVCFSVCYLIICCLVLCMVVTCYYVLFRLITVGDYWLSV